MSGPEEFEETRQVINMIYIFQNGISSGLSTSTYDCPESQKRRLGRGHVSSQGNAVEYTSMSHFFPAP